MKDSYLNTQENCLFCKIIMKKLPCQLIYEDELAIVFEDINPQAPIHLLIVPKAHITNLLEVNELNKEEIIHLFSLLPQLARTKKLDKEGFRTVINSGSAAGQTVYHLHIHLLAGRTFKWPPG